MCGDRVGSVGMALKLDAIDDALTGFDWYTKHKSDASEKFYVLRKIRSYALNTLWSIEGVVREQTLNHIEMLIEYCERANVKGLEICPWS
jgi:hypothetical protein